MSRPAGPVRPFEAGYLLLAMTVVGWGLNWPLMKILLREWPPLLSRGLSSLLAGLGLAALVAFRGQSLAVPPGQHGRIALAGLVNVSIWMGCPTVALQWLSVAEGALLVYTMALWAMLFAWPLRGERPSLRGVVGLALGLAGLVILFSGRGLSLGSDKLPGIALMLGAAVTFALGTVTLRAPAGVAPVPFVAWQVGLGALPLLGLGLVLERAGLARPSPEALGALAYMTIVPMGLCYLTWFASLARLPARTAATATLLVPVVGIGSAALFAGEPFGLREVLAVLLVLSGVALAIRQS